MRALNILLIEDNQDHALLTRKILRQSENVGSVTVVPDGEQALSYLEAEEDASPAPDLILLDVKLPRANGFEVLERIKANPNLNWIPVVLLTTSARDEEIARGYRLGANSYVTKPIRFDEFAQKIRNIEQYWSRVSELPSRPLLRPGNGTNANH